MKKNNERRKFLKKAWVSPVLISLGGLATSASAARWNKGKGKDKGKDKGKGKS